MCLQGAEAEASLVCESTRGIELREDEGGYEEASLEPKQRIKRKLELEGTAAAVYV